MRVGIIGGSSSRMERRNEETVVEMLFKVAKAVLSEAGISREDIDTVVIGSCDVIDGIAISNQWVIDPLGVFLKNETKVEDDGIFALFYAYLRVVSGLFSTAMVASWGKCSEVFYPIHYHSSLDPFFTRPLKLDEFQASALQARIYMEKSGATEEDFAKIALKNYKNASKNPLIQIDKIPTYNEIISSNYVCSPLKEYDIPLITDGAVILILASEKFIKERRMDAVWVSGVGLCSDEYYLGSRDLTSLKSLELAAKGAYSMAQVNPKDIDFAEVSEIFPFYELMFLETLGFCNENEAKEWIREGRTETDGSKPINPSGGALTSNPCPATGLFRAYQAYTRLKSKGKKALAQGSSGICHQINCVAILEA